MSKQIGKILPTDDAEAAEADVHTLIADYKKLTDSLAPVRDMVRVRIEDALRRGNLEFTTEIKRLVQIIHPVAFLRRAERIVDIRRFVRNEARDLLQRAIGLEEGIFKIFKESSRPHPALISFSNIGVPLSDIHAAIDFAKAAEEGGERYERKARKNSLRPPAMPASGAPDIERQVLDAITDAFEENDEGQTGHGGGDDNDMTTRPFEEPSEEYMEKMAGDIGEPLTDALREEIRNALLISHRQSEETMKQIDEAIVAKREKYGRRRAEYQDEAKGKIIDEDTGAFGETEDESEGDTLRERLPRNDIDYFIFELQNLLMRHGASDGNELAVYAEEFDKAASQFAGLRGPTAEKFKEILGKTALLFIVTSGIRANDGSSLNDDKHTFASAQHALHAVAREYGIAVHPLFDKSSRGNKRKLLFGPDDDVTLEEEEDKARFSTARNLTQTNFIWRLLNETLQRAEAAGEETRFCYALYYGFLRELSVRLRPREMRKASAVLHSEPIDVKGFGKRFEQGEIPRNLWRQQLELLNAVQCALRHGERRIYFETPPGTGKTRVLLLLAKLLNPNGNTLLLVPNRYLVEQHARELGKSGAEIKHGKVGQFDAIFDQSLTIATYRGLRQPLERGLFPRDKFSLILLDEVHKTIGVDRDRILQYFPRATVIGATGSGQDADGTEVNRMFTCAYYISLIEGIRAGIVNPVRLHIANIPDVAAGINDAQTDKMDEALEKDLKLRIEAMLEWYRKVCHGRDGSGDKQALIMMDTNMRANRVSEAFRENAVHAEPIHTGRLFNEVHYHDILFREGRLPVAVTSQLLAEGWDYDALECLAIGEQGDRGAYYLQRMGRVVRRINPKKRDSHVLILRGGIARALPGRSGRGGTIMELPRRTPVENLFGLDADFRSGSRIVEPEEGFWPKNPFKFPLRKKIGKR